MEACRDPDYLANKLLETLAQELIHHLQHSGVNKILEVSVNVGMRCGGANYADIPYRYRPHEAEAFAKMTILARNLLDKASKLHSALLRLAKAYGRLSKIEIARNYIEK